MSVLQRRVAVAGVITATAIALPAAALAAGPGSPSGKASPPSSAPAAASKPAPPPGSSRPAKSPGAAQSQLNRLAAEAGISVSQFEDGLRAVKQAGGNTPAGVAAFAAATGVSQATAQRVVDAVFGTHPQPAGKGSKDSGQRVRPGLKGEPGQQGQPDFVNALAAQLGVSHTAALHAFNQLLALGRNINPASPAFAAIASHLGVTPDRLSAALGAAKRSLAGS